MKKVAFPHMGNYYVPVQYLLSHITTLEVMTPPFITSKTIELGSKHSPDFVCTPFKYTLGTYIESLQLGADILLQAGGGCRYGYYSELQEQILKDLGYSFRLINFVRGGKTDIKKLYKEMKSIEPHFHPFRSLYYLWITSKMIAYMDTIDDFIRKNIGFETTKGSFEKLQKEMLEEFSKTTGFFSLRRLYKKYRRAFRSLKVCKPDHPLKVGVIGELYTLMEPFANYDIEKQLASFGIEVTRFTNVHYLLFEKGKAVKKMLKKENGYAKYRMGADALDNVMRAKWLCQNQYDGIIHIKSSFCTPEIGAMPLINRVCKDYHVPVIFFSFDANTSVVGMQTRLEAFYDMIEMRRNK